MVEKKNTMVRGVRLPRDLCTAKVTASASPAASASPVTFAQLLWHSGRPDRGRRLRLRGSLPLSVASASCRVRSSRPAAAAPLAARSTASPAARFSSRRAFRCFSCRLSRGLVEAGEAPLQQLLSPPAFIAPWNLARPRSAPFAYPARAMAAARGRPGRQHAGAARVLPSFPRP